MPAARQRARPWHSPRLALRPRAAPTRRRLPGGPRGTWRRRRAALAALPPCASRPPRPAPGPPGCSSSASCPACRPCAGGGGGGGRRGAFSHMWWRRVPRRRPSPRCDLHVVPSGGRGRAAAALRARHVLHTARPHVWRMRRPTRAAAAPNAHLSSGGCTPGRACSSHEWGRRVCSGHATEPSMAPPRRGRRRPGAPAAVDRWCTRARGGYRSLGVRTGGN